MSEYRVEVIWSREGQPFADRRYSRRHRLRFDGGIEVPGSSSPQVVPLPMSDAAAIDPEEAFVASLSACHMLWFLDIACRAGFVVDRYEDAAAGTMARDAAGRVAMTVVALRPAVAFAGTRQPDRAALEAMHHEAHAQCFIANSVKTEVRLEPVWPAG